jgi:iron complex transport system substrate-binding protein
VLGRSLTTLVAVACAAVVAVAGSAGTEKLPQRIVSLSPTATESLFSIGAGRQVVAVDRASDYPKRAPQTKLSGISPNAEAIARLHPDLVVVQYDANKIVEALGKLNIRVLVQPSASTLADAYAQIRRLGAVTGHRVGATKLVTRMKKQVAALVASVAKPAGKLSVYHELSPDYYSATSTTFIGRVYSLFGLSNIADAADKAGTGYPQLSGEYILASDPSLIVLADTRCCGQSRAAVAARPGWNRLTAVQRGRILVVDDSVASRWGPRIVDFVRAVARALRQQ